MQSDKKNNRKLQKAATVNACKLCTPLGAALAFHGLEDAVCLLHGSQGCSTYIRRYLISHFKEPLDVASSNFTEESAVYGGRENLRTAIRNLMQQYAPRLIGIATTCLAETIGDDVNLFIRELQVRDGENMPMLLPVSTPSYSGTHSDGFHAVTRAVAEWLPRQGTLLPQINLFPGMLSPADLRYLKEILQAFDYGHVMVPDYSDTLDGGLWDAYQAIPPGGTPIQELETLSRSIASVEFSAAVPDRCSAGVYLQETSEVPLFRMGFPIGIQASDAFFDALEEITGRDTPQAYLNERARLADAYVDGHKYVFGKRVIVFGEEDLVAALVLFLREIGAVPVIAASGGTSGRLEDLLRSRLPEKEMQETLVLAEADFLDIELHAKEMQADLVLGHSKGYKLSRTLGIPHVRVGFPVHDRFGGQRILHIGYRGAQQLFDTIVNALLERMQAANPVGYTYL